ncbi:DUF4419 domain-containing protein [Sandaracinus amylolyticus]|uniref:DUF4419 domain-containing protein n=1 Tax=Sandaracinus amylolyticus TaxID=927083 RepID=A0A0F6YNC9_9BACT|nr:DUF4419 domain-containing protein [Sandaracinus amylolyticus]AKF11778.1 hypothetical protein DB32_008927 [Sandaracinus amylolyticus]
MSITFSVSRVEPAGSRLPSFDARGAIELLLRAPVEAWWTPSWPVVRMLERRTVYADGQRRDEHVALHPFVAAAHAAFDEHRPLELSPDAVWLCIAQGFATHVQTHARELRAELVAREGRETIIVRRDDFVLGSPRNPWPDVFAAMSAQVAARTGELHALVVSDFSTTDPVSRAASEITLLAAMQPFFGYQVHTRCGIPAITLTGTPDDWRAIERRAAALSRFDLSWWTDALAPVLAHFTRASQGDVDVAFWQSFYKLSDGSGGPRITGWVNVLLPYLVGRDGRPERNAALRAWRDGHGPTTERLPSGICCVPFLWKYMGSEYRMEFVGGHAAVGQHPHTGCVRPELGWAVRRAP